jgi:hypothetical protein
MRERWGFLKALVWRPLVGLGAVVIASLAALQAVRSELPEGSQRWLTLATYLPSWPWYVWTLIIVTFLLAVVFEAAFRLHRGKVISSPQNLLPGSFLQQWKDRNAGWLQPLKKHLIAEKTPLLNGYADGAMAIMFRGHLHLIVEVVIGNSGYPTEAMTFAMGVVRNPTHPTDLIENLKVLTMTGTTLIAWSGKGAERREYRLNESTLLPQLALGNEILVDAWIRGFMVGKVETQTIASLAMRGTHLVVTFTDNKGRHTEIFTSLAGIEVREFKEEPSSGQGVLYKQATTIPHIPWNLEK